MLRSWVKRFPFLVIPKSADDARRAYEEAMRKKQIADTEARLEILKGTD